MMLNSVVVRMGERKKRFESGSRVEHVTFQVGCFTELRGTHGWLGSATARTSFVMTDARTKNTGLFKGGE